MPTRYGCSNAGYVADYDKLTKAGAELIACVTVNDAFVAAAWGEANDADGKVRVSLLCGIGYTEGLGFFWRDIPHDQLCALLQVKILADPHLELTKVKSLATCCKK